MNKEWTVEWTVETVDEFGDIIESEFLPTYFEAKGYTEMYPDIDEGCHYEIGLIKYYAAPKIGTPDRTYAYIEDGALSEEFDDGTRVPAIYHREVV